MDTENYIATLSSDGKTVVAVAKGRPKKNPPVISVTQPLYERAVKLLQKLVKRFNREGWKLTMTDSYSFCPPSSVIVEGEHIPFMIREKHSRITVPSTIRDWHPLEPNGLLAVEFYFPHSIKPVRKYVDTDSNKVESMIDEMIGWMKKSYKTVRKVRIEREEWDREWQEECRIREEHDALIKDRFNAVVKVLDDYRRYEKATQLRNFCELLKSQYAPSETEKLNQLVIAEQVADWIDPTKDYVDGLLSEKYKIDDLMRII